MNVAVLASRLARNARDAATHRITQHRRDQRLICGAATPSIITLMQAGRPLACARRAEAIIAATSLTCSPCAPKACATRS